MNNDTNKTKAAISQAAPAAPTVSAAPKHVPKAACCKAVSQKPDIYATPCLIPDINPELCMDIGISELCAFVRAFQKSFGRSR